MKQELLDSIRKEFDMKKEKRKKLKEKQKRKAELEQNKWVKEYLELKEELSDRDNLQLVNQTDSEILERSFRNHIHMIDGDTNEIYVYLGTYRYTDEIDIVHTARDDRVDRNSPKADYRLYKNIEDDLDTQQVPIGRCDEFEKEHKIIILKTCLPGEKFYQIQKEFMELAVKKGQTEACKQILEKYQ